MTAKEILNQHRANVVRLLEAEALLDTGGVSQALVDRCKAAYLSTEQDAVEIVEACDDPRTHAALKLRFLLGHSWDETGYFLGHVSAESVRKRCGMYLRNVEKK